LVPFGVLYRFIKALRWKEPIAAHRKDLPDDMASFCDLFLDCVRP
jgi:hypothetical protein